MWPEPKWLSGYQGKKYDHSDHVKIHFTARERKRICGATSLRLKLQNHT